MKKSTDTHFLIRGSLKNGKLNGFVKMYGRYTVDPKGHCSNMVFPGLSFFGWYENGKPTGPCWRRLKGPTYLYGIVDENGDFTGDDISFIYQDLETALVGKFDKGIMVRFLDDEEPLCYSLSSLNPGYVLVVIVAAISTFMKQ